MTQKYYSLLTNSGLELVNQHVLNGNEAFIAYGAEYREQACIEEVASRDPSY